MSIDNAASTSGGAAEESCVAWHSIPPRTLIIDHHDSYTLNLLPLLLHALAPEGATPTRADAALLSSRLLVLPHTHALLEPCAFAKHLAPHLDALLLSPGPGSPEREADFGVAAKLIRAGARGSDLPTLGVCLGHQGIATALGGSVKRASGIRHGVTSSLRWSAEGEQRDGEGMFQDVPEGAQVVRYNSLTVDESTLPSSLRVTAWAVDPVCPAPAPRPEAHAHLSSASLPSSSSASSSAAADAASERVILALQHTTRPLWGVQFHPESIESSYGGVMLRNFVRSARRHWASLAERGDVGAAERLAAWDESKALPEHLRRLGGACIAQSLDSTPQRSSSVATPEFAILERRFGVALDAGAAPDVFARLFRARGAGSLWLDSARRGDPANRFSYMSAPAFSISYDAAEQRVQLRVPHGKTSAAPPASISLRAPEGGLVTPSASRGASPALEEEAQSGRTFWSWFDGLQAELARRTRRIEGPDERFRAGWTGYFGYELGAESMGLPRSSSSSSSSAGPEAEASGMFTPPLEPPANAQLEGAETRAPLPDAHFGFCERVLALDHQSGEWIATALIKDPGAASEECSPAYTSLRGALGETSAQALCQTAAQAQAWFADVEAALSELAMSFAAEALRAPKAPRLDSSAPTAASSSNGSSSAGLLALAQLKPRDSPALYRAKVEAARAHIAQGESYELCLTTQFQGQLPPLPTSPAEQDLDHFSLYCALRLKNPAPYAAFLCLEDPRGTARAQSLLSTSPERFMSVDREGWVEMKPIKGTLARAGWGKGEEHLRAATEGGGSEREKAEWRAEEDARRALSLKADVKERAENLMIVDLIRADLLSFCAAHTVSVPRLMQVETYETVHQLVTTVRGRIARSASSGSHPGTGTGTVEAIRRCFPPGSMTGAPKRRSVQILARLEAERGRHAVSSSSSQSAKRGAYSGALGWIGLSGAASFSVVIRTVVANGSHLSLGAGGAVTYLSSAEREWDEVGDKVAAFGVRKFE